MSYKITISKQALKEFSKLSPKACTEISLSIDSLANNPRPVGCKKLVAQKEYLWRIRSGNYRVIYSIEDKIKIIEIRKIGHRKDIYE